jgi:CRISPR-associated endonuclease/helicase Cas3
MKHYIFSVSATGTENLLRVRSIMDAVAYRIAESTWYAPMSQELLARVKAALVRYARRRVSVVAHAVDGFSRKRLGVVFKLGATRNHYADGQWCVGSRAIHRTRAITTSHQELVRNAGLAHDLGKNTAAFQQKLGAKQKNIADHYRHELLSVLQMMGKRVSDDIDLLPPWAKKKGPKTLGWSEYLVLTHHRLPGFDPRDERIELTKDGHINSGAPAPLSLAPLDPSIKPPEKVEATLTPADFIDARLALMLADHFVSETRLGGTEQGALRTRVRSILAQHEGRRTVYANTDSGDKKGQTLTGHLEAVGRMAAVIAKAMATGRWMMGMPWLDGERFASRAGRSGRFAWQGQAVDLCCQYAENLAQGVPGLVIVGSSTGSGKTRGCMAIAGALARQGLRATVAIGLRTLTLQTGDEYRRVFDLADDEMDVLVGSKAVAKLHAAKDKEGGLGSESKESAFTETGREEGPDHGSYEAEDEVPEVASAYLGEDLKFLSFIETQCRDSSGRRYLGVPLLVSTIDQIVKAANHSRSGWILPWLRLASSNVLIIDEVDGYDLESYPALLRFIELAAVAGVHLIVSSATIYPSLIHAIHRAWENGVKRRMERMGVKPARYPCVFVGDRDGGSFVADGELPQAVERFTAALTNGLSPKRIGKIIETGKSRESAFVAIKDAIVDLHGRHAVDTGFGNRLSVGLVRIAHIRNAVAFASWLDSWLDDHVAELGFAARIVLYHSENTPLGRAYIEKRLDVMLKRSGNPLAPMDDPAVRELVTMAADTQRDAAVIVVATPVEEVGRDHDFDWAVIEPSSARSIVQTSGRVLRHRDVTPAGPNVAVMQMNFSALSGQKGPYFAAPGFEWRYSYGKDLAKLIAGREFLIDASMCLRPTQGTLGDLDNRSIKESIEQDMCDWYDNPYMALAANHYIQHRLRQKDARKDFVIDFDEQTCRNTKTGDSYRIEVVSALRHGLWNVSWADVVESFPMVEVNDKAFRTLRVYEGDVSGLEGLRLSPIWGLCQANNR